MVPEGQDGDGDEDGDEVLEQSHPPKPLFYPLPSGCKRPSGKGQPSAARQPLPLGLPKLLNRAVGQTTKVFLTQHG